MNDAGKVQWSPSVWPLNPTLKSKFFFLPYLKIEIANAKKWKGNSILRKTRSSLKEGRTRPIHSKLSFSALISRRQWKWFYRACRTFSLLIEKKSTCERNSILNPMFGGLSAYHSCHFHNLVSPFYLTTSVVCLASAIIDFTLRSHHI